MIGKFRVIVGFSTEMCTGIKTEGRAKLQQGKVQL